MSKQILFLIFVNFVAVSFTSCGDDKDESQQLYPANAKGIAIWDYDATSVDTREVTMWLNDYSIYYIDYYGLTEAGLWFKEQKCIPYYPTSIDVVYEVISKNYNTEVDADTDLDNFYPNPKGLVNYVKNNKSKYKYIANHNGTIVLFNRTSNVSY